MSIDIRYADAPLGHEIRGVDLSGDIPAADFAEIETAYDRYGVIVFRGQNLTPEQQIAFSRRFGQLTRYSTDRYNMPTHPEIFIVSNVKEGGRDIGLADGGRYWHTDMWSTANPPRGSILYALEVPMRDGEPLGDTWFCSTAAAYDALPEHLRRAVEGRRAVFSTERYAQLKRARTPVDPVTGQLPASFLERDVNRPKDIVQTHDLVKLHPRSGRKCLYFSEEAITHIVDMDAKESDDILAELHRHILQPQFLYRHRWAVGDLITWDNISCMHKAIGDFEPLRRRMHRTTLAALPMTQRAAA